MGTLFIAQLVHKCTNDVDPNSYNYAMMLNPWQSSGIVSLNSHLSDNIGWDETSESKFKMKVLS